MNAGCFKVAPRESDTLLFRLFVNGRWRWLLDVDNGFDPIFETEFVILFWNARAAAFSLICVARFFFWGFAVVVVAFNDDNVLVNSLEVSATFVDVPGLLCA